MPLIASEIVAEAASVYLNDAGRALFTDAILLPHLKSTYDDLQLELLAVDAPSMDEESIVIDVPSAGAGVAVVTLPSDFLYPIELFEKPDGASDSSYTMVSESDWRPDMTQSTEIEVWRWREDTIQIPIPSSARDVKLRYKRMLSAIADINSNVPIVLAKSFLSARTAAKAAAYSGANASRAETIEMQARDQLNKFLGIVTRRMQSHGVRRQPYQRRVM